MDVAVDRRHRRGGVRPRAAAGARRTSRHDRLARCRRGADAGGKARMPRRRRRSTARERGRRGRAEARRRDGPVRGQAEIYRAIKRRVAPAADRAGRHQPARHRGRRAGVAGRPAVARLRRRAGRRDPGQGVRMVAGVPHDRRPRPTGPRAAASIPTCCCAATTPRPRPRSARWSRRSPDLRWVDCGALSMARIAETLTALLISVNRTYKVHDAGFRDRRARRVGASVTHERRGELVPIDDTRAVRGRTGERLSRDRAARRAGAGPPRVRRLPRSAHRRVPAAAGGPAGERAVRTHRRRRRGRSSEWRRT